MLTALAPDMKHVLNNVKLGKVSVPSRVFIPLMEIGLLEIDQCTTLRRGEDAGKHFIPASELKVSSQSQIRPGHKLAINRLSLLLNGQKPEIEPIFYRTLNRRPATQACTLAPSLNTGRTPEVRYRANNEPCGIGCDATCLLETPMRKTEVCMKSRPAEVRSHL